MAIKNFFNRLRFWKRNVDQDISSEQCSAEYRLANKLKRYEKYLSQFQSVVMWDNPVVSVVCILLVNILFWIFASLEWRFYGILSSVMLAASVHEAWTGHVWPEISVASLSDPPDTPAPPSVVAMSKMVTSGCAAVKQYLLWLQNLRVQQPGLFCCLSSLVCTGLLLLGRSVSGLLLVYILLMSVLAGPGLFTHCVPPSLRQTIFQYISCINQAFTKYSNDGSDDEYIPVTTSEDMALLTRASDLHHDTYDSLTNPGTSSDIMSGLGAIPSHEEDSIGTLSDLEPGNGLPLDPADDSDTNVKEHQIEFQSRHFNGDSSSSDEEAFTRDLVFSDADERDAAAGHGLSSLIAQAVTSNVLGSVGMLANVVRQRKPLRTSRRTDTDSDNDDFEIINRDELNN